MGMIRKRFALVVVLVLVVAHGSHIFVLGNVPEFVAERTNRKLDQISPSPGPGLSVKSDPTGANVHNISPKADPTDGFTNERCKMSTNRCHDQKNMIACIQFSNGAHEELLLLVENDGESTLKVNGMISPANIPLKEMQIPGHRAKKNNISAIARNNLSVVLNAGNGDCVISMKAPISRDDLLKQLSSYAAQVTPIHGVYLLSFTALIFGATWACCKWGKRGRRVDGVPYQELEMGQSNALSAMNVETAEGWDEGWDEDWDEEKAMKSPGGNHVGNVSANGLNSRSSNRDGWENDDWDD